MSGRYYPGHGSAAHDWTVHDSLSVNNGSVGSSTTASEPYVGSAVVRWNFRDIGGVTGDDEANGYSLDASATTPTTHPTD